ncbi:helix-turn-helix domain-containing protein [Acinetobacter rudis]|uniref:HTH luxR-type domain-containing protein n=1 Tax=Acinetobacter rudis CIP 110305 TaxID=421052 RepID=S3NJN4_9GAMM|nr:LuxR C-terminal-related transcriptional regulator [Acinetobacter rudis]EPF79887.1 hypothetical protein F945_00775 [Acinetobacter rudis CIP 110305]
MDYIIKIMRSFFHFDAIQILWFSKQNQKHYEVFSTGYNRPCAESLAYDFPKIYPPGFSKILAQDNELPLSISASETLISPAFTESSIYKDYLNKYGFHDGMTLELNDEGNYIGLVHFSSFSANNFNSCIQMLVYNFRSIILQWFKQTNFFEYWVNKYKFYIFNEKNGFAIESLNHNLNSIKTEVEKIFSKTFHKLKSGYFLMNNMIYKICVLKLPNENFILDLSPSKLPFKLTKKEIIVLSFLIVGLSDKEIAKKLVRGERTINSHVASIYRKLEVNNRIEAAVFAVVHGIYILDENGLILEKLSHQTTQTA